jgi:hypothetical protein
MPVVTMIVNGKAVTGDIDARTLPVQFLRENLRLTGTHVGCDTSQCGACVSISTISASMPLGSKRSGRRGVPARRHVRSAPVARAGRVGRRVKKRELGFSQQTMRFQKIASQISADLRVR